MKQGIIQSKLIFTIFFLYFILQPSLSAQYSSSPVILVMDASGSMGKSFHGISRIEAAQYIINEHLASHNISRPFGLVAYGNGLEGCRSQRLYVPVGTGNRNKISETIMKMKPSGSTPIEETLNLIEKKILPSKKDAVIILISDGVESCGGNPGAVAAKIGKKYPKVKIHVIGLSVEKPDARELGDLAKKGKGLFFDVKTSKDFNLALNESLGHQLKSKEVQKKIVTSDSNSAPLLRLKKIEVSDLSSESVKIKVFYETRGISIGNYVLNISAVTPVPFNPWETLVDPGVKQIVFQPVSRYGIGSENSVLEVEFPLKELDNVPILVQGELWKTTKIPNLLDISNRLPLKFR